ncbi:hypothetical protein J6590_015379 [Homalodisca vitripennis]|nr:hypothetical protein J6590_015379 [Homalodisca vitripennis]
MSSVFSQGGAAEMGSERKRVTHVVIEALGQSRLVCDSKNDRACKVHLGHLAATPRRNRARTAPLLHHCQLPLQQHSACVCPRIDKREYITVATSLSSRS